MPLVLVIAAKDLRQRLRDRSALLLAVVAPLLLATIISLAIGGSFTRFRATFAVADEDNGPVAAAFVDGVLRGPAVAKVVHLRTTTSAEEARRLARNDVDAAIVIPAGFSAAVALTVSPSAVTTVYDATLSQLSPNCRASQPIPPPSVSPPTPVCETLPAVVASPCGSVARSRLRRSAPPWTNAHRSAGSTRTSPIGDRSIIRPPSGTDSPRTPWPPHFTAISRPVSRPCRTAAATSSADVQRAMSAGRRSTMAFQISRWAS